MIIVRPAQQADIDRCVAVGREFYEFSPYTGVPYCESSMQELLHGMIEQKMLIIASDENRIIGGIGGCISPMFFNKNYIIAFEMFWWVDPDHRGRLGLRLLNSFEAQAKSLGCAYLMMMTLQKNDIGSLYEKQGFQPYETGYVKRL